MYSMEEIENAMTLFRDALPNAITRKTCERRFGNFFKFLEINAVSLEEKVEVFAQNSKDNINLATSSILKYIRMQKARAEKGEISNATLPLWLDHA